MSKRVIIIGASVGIGKSLAEVYIRNGYQVGLTSRRIELLDALKTLYPSNAIFIQQMDVSDVPTARQQLTNLIATMGGVDIIVLNAGVGIPKATFEEQLYTIDINARGFMGLADAAYTYFATTGGGQIAGVSSLAALRGSGAVPEYHASKAFISNYMEGLQLRAWNRKQQIFVTDIRPGFVDTAMTKANKGMFWVATAEKAANQIYNAIRAKKRVVYITRRWWFMAQLMKILPNFLYKKFV
jgi:short-subunit dehydrogenase